MYIISNSFRLSFRYQGQYEDIETGLYYNRFRYYSPSEGMYISQDPIRLAGNNPSLYGYVKNVNIFFDTMGLSPLFRGTTVGYPGSSGTQRIGITPATTDPRVATIFANHSSQYGEAVVQIFEDGAIDSSKILEGNVLASIEKEVGIDMLPNDLKSLATVEISAKDATAILKDMGYDVPNRVSTGDLSDTFKQLGPMSDADIDEFIRRAKKACK